MTRFIFACLLSLFSFIGNAQDNQIPQWFWDEIASEVGVWITDNSAYQSEQEPFDAYKIEWVWGLNEKSIKGKLSGLINGEEKGTFWEFHIYWDLEAEKPVAMQFGTDGTLGKGFMVQISDHEKQVAQTFFSPTGSTFQIGHKNITLSADEKDISSYTISDEGEWTKNRSYIWKRQTDG